MAAADYTSLVQEIYISYFGRPADSRGLANYAAQLDAQSAPTTLADLLAAAKTNASLSTLVNSFGTSAESVALYGTDTLSFVAAIYTNVLNRTADLDGLLWWANEIDSGRLSKAAAALNIVQGAVELGGTDAAVVAAKVAIATNFTAAIDTTDELLAYSGNAAAATARTMLKTVTATTDATAFQATVNSTLAGLVSGNVPSQSYTLTTGVDNITGTAGDDQLAGVVDGTHTNDNSGIHTVTQTFGGLDVINGGAGNDTLTLTNEVGVLDLETSVKVSNIENLALRSARGNITADVQGWTGLNSVNIEQRGNAEQIIVDTKGNVTNVTISAGSSNQNESISVTDNADTSVLATVSVTGAQSQIDVASDALTTLNLTETDGAFATVHAAAGTRTLTANLNTVTGGGSTTVSDATATALIVNTTGDASSAVSLSAGAAKSVTINADEKLGVSSLAASTATTVSITGDSAVTVSSHTLAATAAITSTNTKGVTFSSALGDTVTFTGGAGADTITIANTNTKAIAMGAGDDTVRVSGTTLGTNGTIDGGAGTDTIALSAADADALTRLSPAATYADRISNFEKVSLGQVAAFGNNSVNLANLDNLNYVVTAGTAAGTGSAEVATVTFNGLLSGQSVTISDGIAGHTQIVTAVADMTAAQVAAAFDAGFVAGSLDDGYTRVVNGTVATLTATTVGQKTNITASVGNSTVNPLTAATTSGGSAAVPAVTETATVTFADIAVGETLVINNVTVTATGGAANAIDIASAFRTGTSVGNAVVTGSPVVLTGWTGGNGSSLNQVVFTSTTANSVVGDLTVGGTATVAHPVVPTTIQGAALIPGVTESANVTFTALTSGQSVLVAGRTVTATGGNLSAAEVEAAYLGGVNAGNAVVGGTIAGWTPAQNGVGAALTDGILTFTSTTASTNVANIDADLLNGYHNSAATAPTNAGVSIVDGTLIAGGGNLTLTNVANAGTVELTGANAGSITVTMKDATGAADSLNLLVKGAAQLAAGAINVAGVETINITATDSTAATATNLNNPAHPSTLALNAADTTSIVLTGNHGVDFTGSTLSKLVELNASAVTGNVDPTGLTAAQIVAANGVAGAVTFTSTVTASAVTISTGNGNDVISSAAASTKAATISTGAGNDVIHGGAGADVINAGTENDTVYSSGGGDTITLGAGKDVYILAHSADSVLAKFDTITDFVANTKGQGTTAVAISHGATTDPTLLTGDTIDISDLVNTNVLTGIKVAVYTNSSDAQTFIQNTGNAVDNAYTGIALDSSTGKLYMDFNSDGIVDSVVTLTGVTTITEAAFVLDTQV